MASVEGPRQTNFIMQTLITVIKLKEPWAECFTVPCCVFRIFFFFLSKVAINTNLPNHLHIFTDQVLTVITLY